MTVTSVTGIGATLASFHRFRSPNRTWARAVLPRVGQNLTGVSRIVPRTRRNGGPDGRQSRDTRRLSRPVLFAVEDDPSTLEMLHDVATDAGWATRGFSQLSDFERAVAERVPDLMIFDDDLPDGRGGDRARELQRDRRLRDVPVLVCTAASLPRQAEIGAWVPVVSKPFDLGEIERILDAIAQGRSSPVDGAAG
jgi:CheY-like chemotaxis protein